MHPRPTAWRPVASEVSGLVGQRMRRAIDSVRDPQARARAKALRRRRRARRSAVFNSATAVVAGSVTATIGSAPVVEATEVAGGSITVLAVVGAVMAGLRSVRLQRTPLPAPPPPPLPPVGSAARAPLARLAATEAGLAELLALLARPRGGVPILPADSVAEIRDSAADVGASLRGTAESLQAVERAIQTCPPGERAALGVAVQQLTTRLDDGVDELSRLVSAAGQAVAAGAAGEPPARLADATERLAGLAVGLRELADPV